MVRTRFVLGIFVLSVGVSSDVIFCLLSVLCSHSSDGIETTSKKFIKGSSSGLLFEADLETALNFKIVKKSLNWF